MAEIRHDPVTGRWVIIARERAVRPGAFLVEPPLTDLDECPFCVGHEAETPSPLAVYGPVETNARDPWWIRVVPNKYPALPGAHEVVIESPRHEESVSELAPPIVRQLFRAYRDRLACWRDRDAAYVLAFKNVRAAAGASLVHSHSQIIAAPHVPAMIDDELRGAHRYFKEQRRCVFCDLVQKELDQQVRIVEESPSVVAWCPFASRNPFEVWLAPRRHASHFDAAADEESDDVAQLMRRLIIRIECLFPNAAYNYVIHTGPCRAHSMKHFHWHVELLPRLTRLAGFEWGGGGFINPVPPEFAAARLRGEAA